MTVMMMMMKEKEERMAKNWCIGSNSRLFPECRGTLSPPSRAAVGCGRRRRRLGPVSFSSFSSSSSSWEEEEEEEEVVVVVALLRPTFPKRSARSA